MSPDSGSPDHDGPSGGDDFPGAGGESEYPDFHRSTRMPLDAVVRLHFEGTVAYQNGFAANVSATGMYVKHPDPPAIGTRLVFELVLGEERKPVQGAGVVAWAREKYEGPGRPAGIGIQFTEIDALSRQHIAEALFAYLETQLGDELAESQDVVDLVATTSTRTPIDFGSFARPEGDDASAPLSRPITPAAALPVLAPPDAGFEAGGRRAESPGGHEFGTFGESPAGAKHAAEGGLFTPEIPPDEMPEPRIAASRPPKSHWPAIVIGVVIAVGAFGAWWFFAGPGSIRSEAPVSAPEAVATDQAAPPPRPALSGQPGTDATLAETIGADGVKAPEPLPVGAATPESGEEAAAADDAAAPDANTDSQATTDGAPEVEAEAAPSAQAAQTALAAPAPAVPTTVPAGATVETLAATGARLSRVTAIDWEESNGRTVVVLTGDGAFPSGSYKWNEIRDANPRVLLRLTGMSSGFGKTLLAAGTPELEKVRIGYHEKPGGNELHVVLDLAAPGVRVESVDTADNRLYVRLTRP